MKQHVKKVIAHPLISGSSVIFIASFISNAGNYLFNLAMGRLLPVSEYGMLLSIISLIGLLTVFQSALTSLFAKFSAKFSAAGDIQALNGLRINGIKTVLTVAIIFFVLLILFTNIIDSFLHLSNKIFWVLASISVFFSILSSFTVGVLQGQLRFILLSFLNILGVASKMIVGIGLVFLGMGVGGGILGFIAYFSLPFFIALPLVLKRKNKSKKIEEKAFFTEFRRHSLPFLLASLGTTFLLSGDVILARHFLSPVESGQFAALSLMGKAIFYLTTPIYFVFFPLIAQKKEKREKLMGTLALAAIIIGSASAFLSAIYFIFPQLIVGMFFPGADYIATIPYLGLFSLYIMVFSLGFLLNTFFLSSGKMGVWKIDLFVSFVFVVLFFMFHENFGQIIGVLFGTSFLLLLLLCIYYKANDKD
jgi:O-antigen/teichoic acid export membrane protein